MRAVDGSRRNWPVRRGLLAAALRAMPQLAAYSAAKAAALAYVRALAADLAGSGVTANVVCPGSTRGPMLEASAAVYHLPSQDTFAGQALLRRLLSRTRWPPRSPGSARRTQAL